MLRVVRSGTSVVRAGTFRDELFLQDFALGYGEDGEDGEEVVKMAPCRLQVFLQLKVVLQHEDLSSCPVLVKTHQFWPTFALCKQSYVLVRSVRCVDLVRSGTFSMGQTTHMATSVAELARTWDLILMRTHI